MADADRALSRSAPCAVPERLRILALAPLPYLRDGVPTFHGGGTIFYAELLPRLARLGHETTVIADAPALREDERRTGLTWDVPNLTVAWFAYEHLSSQRPSTDADRDRMRECIRPLVAHEIRRARPDVVLIGREIITPDVLDVSRQHGLPTLVISHGPAAAALANGAYPNERRRQLLDGLRQVDAIVAVAEHIAGTLRALGMTRVTTIRNVVDATRFRPAAKDTRLLRALDIAPDRVVVGHVSVLRPWKRPFDIVDSAAVVLRSEPRCLYLVVGTGPCRREMEERARRLGLAAQFRFAEEVPHQEMPRYLNLADIVLLPSEREGFPLVYREVQACGRALLASDIPPAREAIVPGRTGMLFRIGDIDELAAQTLVLARDPLLRRRLGAEARAVVGEESVEQWADAYVQALRRAIARRVALAGADGERRAYL